MEQRADDVRTIMSRAEYHAWALAQPRGRTERLAGEIIAMAPERIDHVRVKYATWLALRAAIRGAALPCEAIGDGVSIEVGEDTDYEPDVTVNCGNRLDGGAIAASNPVIVVEVLSPSTDHIDTGIKLLDYFRVPSIQHYLIFQADRRRVIHHRREGDAFQTRILTADKLTLDPPDITINIDAIYDDSL